jgi:hypothetical protein
VSFATIGQLFEILRVPTVFFFLHFLDGALILGKNIPTDVAARTAPANEEPSRAIVEKGTVRFLY